MAKLKTGMARLNASGLVTKATYVISQLTAHAAIFPSPNPSLAELQVAKDELLAAVAATENGGKREYAAQRAAKNMMKALLDQEAHYVSYVANGDEGLIIKGGFDAKRPWSPVGILPAPRLHKVRPSAYTGAVDLWWDRLKDARNYVVRISESDPSEADVVWTCVATTTRRRHTVKDLVPGKVYWFIIEAVGTAGMSPTSAPVMGRAA